MAQYYLVEQQNLLALPWAETARRIGFLDFLRALQNDPPALPRDGFLRIEGLEDVLVAARPKMEEIALQIHRVLKHSAGDLTRWNTNIAIIIRNRIISGAQLMIAHPTAQLPIHLIFNSPIAQETSGRPFYPVSFNLSPDF